MRLAVPEIDPATIATWRRDAPVMTLGGETMGTTWSVKLAVPPAFDQAATRAAIEARLEDILAQMSHWRANSLLGQFNAAPAGTWFALPGDFAIVMTTALSIAERSDGAFDPAIGALVDRWGHGPVAVSAPPCPDAIAQARAVSGYRRLTFAQGRLCQPGGARLDLSGIAKGFAVDALADLLAARGCDHALVEIGGELAGRGLRPDGDPWWVDLETPAEGVAPLRLALHQLAVATSGDYVRGRHTIAPRTGQPVAHAMAISVLHASAMQADAWATALGVLAPPAMAQVTLREGLAVRALVRHEGQVREWISPALQTLLA
jgi:FAD:protein FMN transferase